jgi:hypothetical protein
MKGIEKVLVVSTVHIRPENMRALDEGGRMVMRLVVDQLPYGVRVRVPLDPEMERELLDAAPEIAVGLALAAGAGCDWLQYDADGEVCEPLENLGVFFEKEWGEKEENSWKAIAGT